MQSPPAHTTNILILFLWGIADICEELILSQSIAKLLPSQHLKHTAKSCCCSKKQKTKINPYRTPDQIQAIFILIGCCRNIPAFAAVYRSPGRCAWLGLDGATANGFLTLLPASDSRPRLSTGEGGSRSARDREEASVAW